MTSISVSIRMVDGSLSEFTADEGFLNKLCALQAQGLRGKQLIHVLLSNDWGHRRVSWISMVSCLTGSRLTSVFLTRNARSLSLQEV